MSDNPMNGKDVIVALSSFPDVETAAGIARTLVEETLAACVNIVPGIRSIYSWKGVVQDEPEVMAVMKTTAGRLPKLRERLVALHPYETPELVAVRVADGHDAYLSWVAQATRAPDA